VAKQCDQVSAIKPVKENVVEGVLKNYLDQLLVTATQPQQIEKVIRIPKNIDVAAEAITKEVLEAGASINADSTTETIKDEVAEFVSEAVIKAVPEVIKEPSSQPLINQEAWSSQGVECLVFSVCGLKLAVPLLFLGGVHEVIPGEVKPLMGQPKWYLGMVNTAEHNLQVIDTANFIMPERAQSLAEQGFRYLIQLDKTPWAIACQSIDDTVRLEASEIKWRGDRGKRIWLAGTVIEKMCALVDVSGLLQRIELSCKAV
jgi:purine-binding chemotaxis protein CheW